MDSLSLMRELQCVLSKIRWNIVGIKTTEGQIIPVPPESRIVTVILQALAIPRIQSWARSHNINVEDLTNETRSYPDIALSGGDLGSRLVALDIKSARFLGDDKVSRMTLGTYHGYFLNPNEKILSGGRRCYNDYDEHWIAAFIYEWKPNLDTLNMVKIVEVIVAYKWQVASRYSGSGDTANIGGLDSLSRLRNLQSDFKNEEEFEEYWRDYGKKHPRRGTKIPKSNNLLTRYLKR
ncbi:MAG: type II restriction endonuclease [Nitrososphaeria archaeon]